MAQRRFKVNAACVGKCPNFLRGHRSTRIVYRPRPTTMDMMTLSYRLRTLSAAMLLLLGGGCAAAAQPAPQTAVAGAPVQASPLQASPALWKVADADTTIYLFGTIHVLPEPVEWNRGPVARALASSDMLVTEAIIESQAALQQEFVAKALRTDGKSLRDTMTPANRVKYEATLTGLGLPESTFDTMEAWFAALALGNLPLQKAGYSQANGVEEQLNAYAKEHGTRRDALETPEFQLAMFDTLPEEAQLAYLASVVDELPKLDSEITRLVAAWKAGKAEELARILNDDETDPRLQKVLLADRNANWAKWIKARLATPGTVFVAVGAGHLAGKDSVQDDLAKDGIKSVRVQ